MATALYVSDGIFNTQDLLKIETDGVELMLCIFCSVGCSVWFLILVGETFLVYARVKEQLGSEEIWDKETDDYRRTNLTRGHSVKSALSAMTDRSATALPAMLLHMKKSSTDGNTTDKPQDVEMSETPNPAAEPAQSSTANSEVTVSSTENAHDVTTSAGTSNALPDGWSEIKDPTSGHSYYHHPTKGTQVC